MRRISLQLGAEVRREYGCPWMSETEELKAKFLKIFVKLNRNIFPNY